MIIGDTVLQMLLTEEQRMLAPNGALEPVKGYPALFSTTLVLAYVMRILGSLWLVDGCFGKFSTSSNSV